MLKIFRYLYDGSIAVIQSVSPSGFVPEKMEDFTDYERPFKVRMQSIRSRSTRLSPSILEGTFVEDHSFWELKSETERRRIELMLRAKDVVEWLVCEPIGANDDLVNKMEHEVLCYFADLQKKGASDQDILVAWNYISTSLAGAVGREFQIKTVN